MNFGVTQIEKKFWPYEHPSCDCVLWGVRCDRERFTNFMHVVTYINRFEHEHEIYGAKWHWPQKFVQNPKRNLPIDWLISVKKI